MKTWSFLINPFLEATEGSYRNAKKIGNFTVNALNYKKSDPFFQSVYDMLYPLNADFSLKYINWISQLGTQKGKTKSKLQLLKELSGEAIENWDINIQQYYKRNTSQYTELLPKYRIPFQQGSQEDRISAVGALIAAIDDDANLQPLKADASKFYTLLNDSLQTQQKHIGGTKDKSEEVDDARIVLCDGLWQALMQLGNHFTKDPLRTGDYFDLETIRNRHQSTFKHNIAGGETRLALTNTFQTGELIRFINRGNTNLYCWLAREQNDPIPAAGFITITANDESIIKAEDLGNIKESRFLKVANASATEEGRYTVILL